MSHSHNSTRFRRGDTSPEHEGLLFFRYLRGREVWVTPETMKRKVSNARAVDKKWKASETGQTYMREYFREYNQLPKQKEYHAKYYSQESILKKQRDKYANDPEYRQKLLDRQKTEKGKAAQKAYRKNNPDKIRETARNHRRKKMANDPVFFLYQKYRKRIAIALKAQGVRKNSRTAKMLGCTFEFFRGYMQAQFTEGMNWQNHGSKKGQWEIDHIIPIARFDLENEQARNAAFHYTNCQPKWAEQNRHKSDFIQHNGRQVRARDIRKIIPFNLAA